MIQDNGTPWHYIIKGKSQGPVPVDQIIQLLNRKALTKDSLVWQNGMNDWVPIAATSLMEAIDSPPPCTGTVVNNTVAWLLAFAPLLGFFLQLIVANLFNTNFSGLWKIPPFITLSLSLWDFFIVKKAGHMKKMTWHILITPCYLYKRAKLLKQSLLYFIFWIFSFILAFFWYLLIPE